MIDDQLLYEVIGKTIKQIRRDADLNQTDFAERIGLERTSVTNIERGKQRVTISTLFTICEEFGIPNVSHLVPEIREVTKLENPIPPDSRMEKILVGKDTSVEVDKKTFEVINRLS